MIRLGNTYEQKYLGHSNIHEVIDTKPGFIKSYLIRNNANAPMYRGKLNILADGRAVMNVNYMSYSGIKNKYENYFDSKGREIIHDKNSTKEEKKVWLLNK